jgi:hypothetical protein
MRFFCFKKFSGYIKKLLRHATDAKRHAFGDAQSLLYAIFWRIMVKSM